MVGGGGVGVGTHLSIDYALGDGAKIFSSKSSKNSRWKKTTSSKSLQKIPFRKTNELRMRFWKGKVPYIEGLAKKEGTVTIEFTYLTHTSDSQPKNCIGSLLLVSNSLHKQLISQHGWKGTLKK